MGNMGGHDITSNGKITPMSELKVQVQVGQIFRDCDEKFD